MKRRFFIENHGNVTKLAKNPTFLCNVRFYKKHTHFYRELG